MGLMLSIKMQKTIRIGTRDSQLAIWQANEVKRLLELRGYASELVYIKSEGDLDLLTPLYEMGVEGIFTRSLDTALLNFRIDLAVHSMKDVPIVLPVGLTQAAVLERASEKDILVYKHDLGFLKDPDSTAIIATSSIRRKAQWLNRYPNHTIENIRGNVNTRLVKLQEQNWDAAIFAAAGLERIGLRPDKSIDLDWMIPAPAQGAIMVISRTNDQLSIEATSIINHSTTATCTKIERDFLRTLLGGCSTPISAYAEVKNNQLIFTGNMLSPDGKDKVSIELVESFDSISQDFGIKAAKQLLEKGGNEIAKKIRTIEK
jgi:hydroxymethylbilane synthase